MLARRGYPNTLAPTVGLEGNDASCRHTVRQHPTLRTPIHLAMPASIFDMGVAPFIKRLIIAPIVTRKYVDGVREEAIVGPP